MTVYIAFGHRKRVGKDTAARFLRSEIRIKRHGSDIQTHGFADKLKDICYQLYSWAGLQPGDHYEEPEHNHEKDVVLPLIGKSPRQIWIDVGNGIRERVYRDTWLDYLLHNIKCDICIIKDMRFPNEAEKILEKGGFVYKIERDSIVQDIDGADDPLEGFMMWSGVLKNNGTLQELNGTICKLSENLLLQI